MPAQPQEAPAPTQESYGLYNESQRPEQYPPLGSQKPQGTSGPMAMIQRAMQAQGIPMEELPIVLTYVLKDNNRAANVDALTMDDMTDVLRDIQQYAAETNPLPEPTAELPLSEDTPADNMEDLEASYSENGGEVNDDPETWNEGWPEPAQPGGGANQHRPEPANP